MWSFQNQKLKPQLKNKRRTNPNVALLVGMEAVPGVLAVLATQLCVVTLQVDSAVNQ